MKNEFQMSISWIWKNYTLFFCKDQRNTFLLDVNNLPLKKKKKQKLTQPCKPNIRQFKKKKKKQKFRPTENGQVNSQK